MPKYHRLPRSVYSQYLIVTTLDPVINSLKKASDGLTKYIQTAQFVIGFEIKNEIEGQCQSSRKLIGILTVASCEY